MTDNEAVLKQCIQRVFDLSSQSFLTLLDHVEYKSVSKNDIFIKKGRIDDCEYFLLDGVCRSFLYSPDGSEVTISFFQGPAVLSPHTIRTENGKSIYFFQASTDLLLGRLNAHNFLNLMIKHLDIREFGNAVLRNELILKVNKEVGLASLSARERLLQFRKQYAMLENFVPHPQIASYLGITNISLSRLRGDIARE